METGTVQQRPRDATAPPSQASSPSSVLSPLPNGHQGGRTLPNVRGRKGTGGQKARRVGTGQKGSPGQANNPVRRGTNKGKRARAWCFTENTVPADDAEEATKFQRAITEGSLQAFGPDVRYIIWQKERGVDSDHDHLQGYAEFHRPYGLSGVKSRVSDTAHWEIRTGPQAKAIAYCRKRETWVAGPWEYGCKAEPGTRTDIIALRDAVKAGSSKRKLIEDMPREVAKFPRFINDVKDAYHAHGWRPVKVTLLIGKTRTGKTRWVYDNFPMDSFWCLPAVITTLWFDGYDGETHVLFDDFSGRQSRVSVTVLLQILDGYSIRLPKKGGFISWAPEHIAITTNISPNKWYSWNGRGSQFDALAARFSSVMIFHDDKTVKVMEPEAYFTINKPLYYLFYVCCILCTIPTNSERGISTNR